MKGIERLFENNHPKDKQRIHELQGDEGFLPGAIVKQDSNGTRGNEFSQDSNNINSFSASFFKDFLAMGQ